MHPIHHGAGCPLRRCVGDPGQMAVDHARIPEVAARPGPPPGARVDGPDLGGELAPFGRAAEGLDPALDPPVRVIKEKRATFAQTPAALACRAPAQTRWRNLLLAGDWTDTGYPATIESAVRSGRTAAGIILDA